MLQDAQAMVDRLVDLTRHTHPGIRLNAVWALMVRFVLLPVLVSVKLSRFNCHVAGFVWCL